MSHRAISGQIILIMIAFAANSVLCRVALSGHYLDPVTFSTLRLASGAVVLLPLIMRRGWAMPGWPGLKTAVWLLVYALFFSIAYIHLAAGTGALLLFGAVQLAMILYGMMHGESLGAARGGGLLLAIGGMLLLLLPGASAPPVASALLMIAAGLAWAAYTIAGRRTADAGLATAWNFLLAAIFSLPILPFFADDLHISGIGIVLAILSGAAASAAAYTLWYAILPRLESVTASTVHRRGAVSRRVAQPAERWRHGDGAGRDFYGDPLSKKVTPSPYLLLTRKYTNRMLSAFSAVYAESLFLLPESSMSDWNPSLYLKFGAERTRPAAELLSRIAAHPAQLAVDLGCGPGNSTALLRHNWPQATIIGVDNSPAMLEEASQALPDCQFMAADIRHWQAPAPTDVIYANASLQWLSDHQSLFPHLVSQLAKDGVLAVQMPDNWLEPSHTLMREVAAELGQPDSGRHPLPTVQTYYDLLTGCGCEVDIWRTTYFHPLASHQAIIDWLQATGLRPYLQHLDEPQRELFLSRYLQQLQAHYPLQCNGNVLLLFPRLFIVARRRS